MGAAEKGVVAAGHPLTAQAGARVLREGGNAVDAAVAAMLTSFVAEPLLTGLGAGGYMLVAGGGVRARRCSTSSSRRPPRATRGRRAAASRRSCTASRCPSATPCRRFHIGPASCGVYGVPAGVCEAMRRWGTVPLDDLAAPAARLARDGVALNQGQAYVAEILADLLDLDARVRRAVGARGRDPARGRARCATPSSRRRCCGSASDGAEPFYRGDIAAAVCDWLRRARRLAQRTQTSPTTAPIERDARDGRLPRPRDPHQPAALGRRHAARLLARAARPRASAAEPLRHDLAAMGAAQARAHAEFVEGLDQDGFLEALPRYASRLHHAHLGDRLRRLRVQRHVHQRRGLRAWWCPARAST